MAIAIGDNADRDVLAKFTGSAETVLEVHNAAALKKLIKFVSVRASQIASQSVQARAVAQTATAESDAVYAVPVSEKQAELAKQIEEIKADISEEEEW